MKNISNKSPKKKVFATPEEESVHFFEESKHWVGAKVKEGKVQKFTSSILGQQTDAEALYGIQNSKVREACIKQKVEIFCGIHIEDIEIYQHYVTSNNGVILWFKTQEYIAAEILRVAPRIRSPDFQIKTYVPVMARDRKRYIDQLFLDYKEKKDPKFRYFVKNGINDLEILCKTMSSNGPYRRISNFTNYLKPVSEDSLSEDDEMA